MPDWVITLLMALIPTLTDIDTSDGYYDEIMDLSQRLGFDIEKYGQITPAGRRNMQRIRLLIQLDKLEKEEGEEVKDA